MKMRPHLLVLPCLLAAACADGEAPTEAEQLLTPMYTMEADNFRTHLAGAEEAVPTRAQGQAVFQLDGDVLHYRLMVANIENVLMAHIHLAPAGANGPPVVWLYPAGPPPQLLPGRTQGVLATGEITSADLVGPLGGRTLADLLDALRNGGAYVNVHTSAYPGGEIRGQID